MVLVVIGCSVFEGWLVGLVFGGVLIRFGCCWGVGCTIAAVLVLFAGLLARLCVWVGCILFSLVLCLLFWFV